VLTSPPAQLGIDVIYTVVIKSSVLYLKYGLPRSPDHRTFTIEIQAPTAK